MKVVAINASPRKEGNTFILLNTVLDELKKEGIETELNSLSPDRSRGASPATSVSRKRTGGAPWKKTP